MDQRTLVVNDAHACGLAKRVFTNVGCGLLRGETPHVHPLETQDATSDPDLPVSDLDFPIV